MIDKVDMRIQWLAGLIDGICCGVNSSFIGSLHTEAKTAIEEIREELMKVREDNIKGNSALSMLKDLADCTPNKSRLHGEESERIIELIKNAREFLEYD